MGNTQAFGERNTQAEAALASLAHADIEGLLDHAFEIARAIFEDEGINESEKAKLLLENGCLVLGDSSVDPHIARAALLQQVETLRPQADELAQKFRRLYAEASEAYSNDAKATAKTLSLKAKEIQAECQDQNREIAERLWCYHRLGEMLKWFRLAEQAKRKVQTSQDWAQLVTKHAFDSHKLHDKNAGYREWPGYMRTEDEMCRTVARIISNPARIKKLDADRTAYYDQETDSVVILNQAKPHRSSFYQPYLIDSKSGKIMLGREYFDQLE